MSQHPDADAACIPERTLVLFDVDGTLTRPRHPASADMLAFLQHLRTEAGVGVGIVGGSDLSKITEQLGPTVVHDYEYVFAENGLVAFAGGRPLAEQSLVAHLGEQRLRTFVDFCHDYVHRLNLPVKCSQFVEVRAGMINVSPIGRSCSQAQRDAFELYDREHCVRATFIAALQERFPDYGLTYSVGGQISFDVFPHGWDKTYCLRFVEHAFDDVHFFGDKTAPGGNDHEIYSSPRTIGHTVAGPDDTIQRCTQLFLTPACDPRAGGYGTSAW